MEEQAKSEETQVEPTWESLEHDKEQLRQERDEILAEPLDKDMNAGSSWWIFWVAVAVVVFFWGVNLSLSFPKWGIESLEWDGKAGSLGDMFGMSNALFSGLALAFVVFTLFMQKEELKLQREEMSRQRKELKLQRVESRIGVIEQRQANLTSKEDLRVQQELADAMRQNAQVQALQIVYSQYEELKGKGQATPRQLVILATARETFEKIGKVGGPYNYNEWPSIWINLLLQVLDPLHYYLIHNHEGLDDANRLDNYSHLIQIAQETVLRIEPVEAEIALRMPRILHLLGTGSQQIRIKGKKYTDQVVLTELREIVIVAIRILKQPDFSYIGVSQISWFQQCVAQMKVHDPGLFEISKP